MTEKEFKNEWDLLSVAIKEINENQQIILEMVKANKEKNGAITSPGLKFKNEIYLTEQHELEQVFDILYNELDVVIITDYIKLTFSIYTQESAPEQVENFPF